MTTREVVLEGGSPWGFRMHGGIDTSTQLKISRVNPGSKAALRGIREGDFITSINGKSTKNISNVEAHNLLKNAGENLVLGLNEDCEGSPKRRQYRTVHQETHEETVKKSSVTTFSIKTSQHVESKEPSDNEENLIKGIEKNNQINGKQPDKPKLSSNGISTESTISTLTEQATVRSNSTDFAIASQRSSYSNLTPSPSSASTLTEDGIWSPGQRQDSHYKEERFKRYDDENGTIPPVWTPKSATTSPIVERKEFKPVNFQSPVLGRKRIQSTESIGTPDSVKSEARWKLPDTSATEASLYLSSSLEKRLPNSSSLPASGFCDLGTQRLPRAQNPTITLLQKAREGQLPRGAHYIEPEPPIYQKRSHYDRLQGISPVYSVKSEYLSDSENERSRRGTPSSHRQHQGSGHTTKDGMPIILRSEIRDEDQSKWYKKMYDTIHKQKPRNTQYPYASGYLSEPEPGAYDSDYADYKYATLDRRRTPYKERDHDYTSASYTMPRNLPNKSSSSSDILRNGQDLLKPGRIENYTPGHSSIAEKEAKEWWDEVMDIFDGHLDQQKKYPPQQPKSFINQALKESGYESDSTLVFRRKEEATSQPLSPKDQKEAYKTIQKGGDVPFHGLRKNIPDRPKDEENYMETTSLRKYLKSIKPQRETTCYPVTVHNKNTFASAKKSAPSKANIPIPPAMPPPSPPKRKSSRNNSTLRFISTMKVKSPSGKRHEHCFASTSNVEKGKIGYLRDKITCKLSPNPDNKNKVNVKVYKTVTTNDTKSKITSSLSTIRSTKSLSKINSVTNISNSRDNLSSLRSRSVEALKSPTRPFTPTTIRKITKSNDSLNKLKTFGAEKKKFNLPLTKVTKGYKSSDLPLPNDNKKVPSYKTSTVSLASTRETLPIQVGITEKGKKVLKSTIQKPLTAKSKTSMVKSSMESLRSNRSTKSTASSTSTSKKTQKSKKDKINDEIAKKSKSKLYKDNTKTNTSTEKDVFQRKSFFKNLFLRNASPPPKIAPTNTWLMEKTNQLQRKLLSPQEPSVGAMKVYLKHTKPVTDSKFLSLDYDYSRSRSASPRSVTWKSNENLTEASNKRSLSLPAKIILSQTSRPVSPILRHSTSRLSPSRFNTYTKRGTSPISPNLPKIILTETVRPRSPIVEKRRITTSSPRLNAPSSKLNRSSSEKLVFTETSRPVSPVITHKSRSPTPLSKLKECSQKKMIFSDTSRPVSPRIERTPPRSIILQRSPTRYVFSETTRPISPIVNRRPQRPPSPELRKSPSRMVFSETSRPVSPMLRRSYSPIKKEKSPSCTSLKMFFSETSRPVSPIVKRRVVKKITPPASPKLSTKMFFSETSRPKSPVVVRKKTPTPPASPKIYRSASTRVISRSPSPLVNNMVKSSSLKSISDFRQTSSPLEKLISPPRSPKVIRSPSCRKIMNIKNQQHESTLYMCPNISHSVNSLCSESDYHNYVKELVGSSRKGEKFKDLNNFYTEIAKVGELEKTFSLKPRKKSESEIIDFDRWKEVRTREKAERELNSLYRHIKENEKEKGFLFLPKDVSKYKWKKEFDRGLRIKDKSVGDIKGEFEKLKQPKFDQRFVHSVKDAYKPLWRGNSVVNLANQMTTRRSQSEGRVATARQKLIETERLLTHGIGSRIWSSLSLEQVNTLKDQLSEIYNQNSNKFNSNKPVDYSIEVPRYDKPVNTDLSVRRNSEASEQSYIFKNVSSESKPASLSTSCLTTAKISESKKRELSQTLSKEVLDVISKRKNANKVVVGKEILGAIAAKDAKLKATLPVKPLVRTNALNTVKILSTSETDSTDESTKTVIHIPSEEIKNKVEYFETAPEREVYTPTIYKPADDEDDVGDTITVNSNKLEYKPLNKTLSNSCQNIKELFGEKELVKFATMPLTTSKSIPKPPQLRQIDLSPLRTPISNATSYDSLCRSRSLSPFFEDTQALVKSGEVHRLKNRFELSDSRSTSMSSLNRSQSDSELNREYNSILHGYVDALRRNYEFPRGRSRVRRGGVVSPMFLRAEDRYMPHINIISKIARLHTKKPGEKSKSTEELAAILGCPVGEVHKLKKKYEEFSRDISLMGHVFTSSPNVKELRDIAPYLAASWMAHRYPKSEDNTRSLSSPDNSMASKDTSLVRKDRPKSSPPPSKSFEAKKQDPFEGQGIHRPVDSYQPKTEAVRYNRTSTHTQRPSVSFKEPEAPPPPEKGRYFERSQSFDESPRKYVENEVTIHYRTPVRQEIKEFLSEDELAHKQAEAMKKIYQEERRRKYLQELQDMNRRRHTDNFIPSQKSPISLNRYDDFEEAAPSRPRPRSPEPRLLARALYNFVGQTARELTFRKGDLIHVRRQVDKNWYEGELNAMVGLLPVNHVEIVPHDGIKATARKSYEGQGRAKYNFVAQTQLELSLAKGELVTITRKVDQNWYEGKIGGRKGIFPVAYIEVLIDPQDPPTPSSKPVASPAAHSMLLNGSAGGKESMGTHSYTPILSSTPTSSGNTYQAKPIHITGNGTYGSLNRYMKSPVNQALHIETQSETIPYRALYKYNPQNDDELELLEGDTVYVLEKCDDGWFVGSSDRTGAFGTFPGNYVEKI